MDIRDEAPLSEREQTDESLRAERELADHHSTRTHLDETADAVMASPAPEPTKCLRRLARNPICNPRLAPSARLSAGRESEKTKPCERSGPPPTKPFARSGPSTRPPLAGAGGNRQGPFDERARADAALTARDAFLGIVSHDLRNMLGGMVGFATLIAKGVPREAMKSRFARRSASSAPPLG